MIRIAALVALLAATTATAAFSLEEDLPGPMTVRVGWSYPAAAMREVAGKSCWALGVGYQDRERGLLGLRGVDGALRTAHAATGRYDELNVFYVERIPWQNQVYGGLGAGLLFSRLQDRREDGDGIMWFLMPAVQGLVGYQFQPPADGVRLALEFTATGAPSSHGYTASSITTALVAGF